MFSLVVPKPASVKFGIFSLHYRLIPLTVRLIMQAEGMTDRWLYNRLIRPVGLISALFKPFVASRLVIECKGHIEACLPDPSGDDAAQQTAQDLRAYAEFLPRVCYYYKWPVDKALELTLRDAVWFMRCGNYFETQNNEFQIKLAGGKVSQPAELKLDSRFGKGETKKMGSQRFAALQIALRTGGKHGTGNKTHTAHNNKG